MTDPRTRDNPLIRSARTPSWLMEHVGVATLPLTCPRCGWACGYQLRVYWDSEWNEHGGMCGLCAYEASAKFDRVEWPPDPLAEVEDKPAPVEIQNKLGL